VTPHGTMLSSIDRAARLAGIPAVEAQRLMAQSVFRDVRPNDYAPVLHVCAECAWHDDGRPSYQIAGPLAEALQATNLGLGVRHVRFPHRAFAIELPQEGPGVILEPDSGRRLRAALVASVWAGEPEFDRPGSTTITADQSLVCRAPDGDHSFRLMIVQSWEDEDDEDPPWMLSTMSTEHTVEEACQLTLAQPFREVGERPPGKTDPTCRPGSGVMDRVLRLAFGAALFAVGANASFISPVPEERKRRRKRERQEKRGRAIRPGEELVRRWSLGANIQLPGAGDATGSARANAAERERYALTWSHMRQGHLRMSRCGPRSDWHYTLHYIAPTVVKPELGFPPDYQATRHSLLEPDNEREAP